MSRTPQEQLVHFLSDMYSVEQQALAQMVSAPDMAGDAALAEDFRRHQGETEQQAERIRECLEAHGGSPSAIKDAVMKLGGKGFLLFARTLPETPGRLLTHAYSYEAMEWAGYQMLRRFAEAAADARTAAVAESIADEERTMMERLEQRFDAIEQLSHQSLSAEDLQDHIRRHLAEVHAFEAQREQLLDKSEGLAIQPLLQDIYARQVDETLREADLIERRLKQLDGDTSTVIDSAMALGGLNWGLFFQVQSDTPAKLAAFVYAFLHLEIAGYELLRRTADRGCDTETSRICRLILSAKRTAARELVDAFDTSVSETLQTVKA